jgi:hypothetical protein
MEYKLNLSSTENKDLVSYCNLNDLRISEVIKKSYLEGFNIERYGLLSGKVGGTQEKQVEKEVIREKRVEIPVEVIKEVIKIEYVEVPVEVIKEVSVEKIVEVIKEVPVERVVIKEVPVEKVVTKIEYISDNSQTKELLSKIQELENQMSKKDENLEYLRRDLDIALDKPPVEVEKIVEVIKEVIKEVVVEKETTDNSLKPKLDALQNTVQKLKQDNIDKDKLIKEYEQTIKDIQVHQQSTKAMYLRGSNLDEKLYNNK